MKITIDQRTLHFKQPAGTSRGVYTTRRSWLVTMSDGEHTGLGECAPLPRLSCDDLPHYGQVLRECCDEVARTGVIPARDLSRYPSILFGLETAMRHLQGGNIDCGHGRQLPVIYDTPFTRGEEGIPINGLVWMGTHDEMLARLETKLKQGYGCVKLKIGAIDFERELDLIAHIRERFTPEQVELRVDANGGFTPACALKRLEALAPYGIHSIEQPVMAGQWQVMARLCQDSPVPIALDEELIGVNTRERKIELLDTIKPPLHHLETLAARRHCRHTGMGAAGHRARHRQLDNQRPREQRGAQRHRPTCRPHLRAPHRNAARTGHRTALYRQYRDAT
jgi:o-succinylbenzoate synthase